MTISLSQLQMNVKLGATVERDFFKKLYRSRTFRKQNEKAMTELRKKELETMAKFYLTEKLALNEFSRSMKPDICRYLYLMKPKPYVNLTSGIGKC